MPAISDSRTPGPASDPVASLPPGALDRLRAYAGALAETNRQLNLSAVRDQEGIWRRLILESLRLLPAIDAALPGRSDPATPASLIDVGTGGGVPGLVIALARPDIRVTLLDATAKKLAFLERIAGDLDAANVTCVHGRAEELGHDLAYREAFDLVTARAVAALPVLLELCLPFLRPGGTGFFPKGIALDTELAEGRVAAPLLGGRIIEASILPGIGSEVETRLVVVRKTDRTPRRFPRRTGVPAKQPLGAGSRNRDDGRADRTKSRQ